MGFLDFFTGNQPPLIIDALDDVKVMLDTGRDLFAASSGRLLENEILDTDLSAQEAVIRKREQSVRRAVLEHLNIDPKRELVLCVKLLTVAQEAERIGYLGRTMEKAATLATAPRIGAIVDEIRELRTRTLGQFNAVRDCFIEGDIEKAESAQMEQEAIAAVLREVFVRLAKSELSANKAVVCAVGAHSVGRVGEHLASIARCVTEPLDRIRAGS
jgi:phosphate uptake regulator